MTEHYSLGKYRATVENAIAEASRKSWVRRLWAKDATLWKTDSGHAAIIANAMGWLNVAEELAVKTRRVKSFAEEVRAKGFTSTCLLGMGGSSLCPEVCAVTYGKKTGFLNLLVLDTTDPASILNVERKLDLARTLFIVASKSGGTIESASLQKYFYEKLAKVKGGMAGENFVAITDPGTSLENLANDLRFRDTFLNMKDIGGRYSALSYFGLVPMALIGLDVDEILKRAANMMQRCQVTEDPTANPGLRLGVTLGTLALSGLDKLTLHFSPEISTFGWWVEQLVAESTGKEGLGILPVEGETLGTPSLYGNDRVFIQVHLAGGNNAASEAHLRTLEEAGHPVLRWELQDAMDLGSEFFLWEFATAVAGAVLAINPFDQPNVQESKDNTQRIIRRYSETRRFDEGMPAAHEGPLSLYCSPEMTQTLLTGGAGLPPSSLPTALASFFRMAQPRDYAALLAYIDRSPANGAALDAIRVCLREKLGVAATIGFGPRFLHSTGQLHKGGANNGIFLQITAQDSADIEIPGASYSFGTLKRAQSIGDMEALIMRGRRAVRLHIEGDLADGLLRLAHIVESF